MSSELDAADVVVVDAQGRVGIGTPTPTTQLDVVGSVTASGTVSASTVSAGTVLGNGQSLTMASGSLQTELDAKLPLAGGTVTGALTLNEGVTVGAVNAKAGPTGDVTVSGGVVAANLRTTNPMQHRMYPAGPLVYQNIGDAFTQGVITKIGSPVFDDTTYLPPSAPWNHFPIIEFGGNNEADGDGAQVTVPTGYDTLWVRVLGDRWNVIKTYYNDGTKDIVGAFCGGMRTSSGYSPDGSTSDGGTTVHQWIPIPVGRPGPVALISRPNTNSGFWLSGLAFSKNPWGHATQSALGYHWASNGGDAIGWNSDSWYGDVLGAIAPQTALTLMVPVVDNGHDKLLYLVCGDDAAYRAIAHTGVTVGGNNYGRFMTTYDNPFARFWNTRTYDTYAALHVPAAETAGARFVEVVIDMSNQTHPLNVREIGSHDVDVPWSS